MAAPSDFDDAAAPLHETSADGETWLKPVWSRAPDLFTAEDGECIPIAGEDWKAAPLAGSHPSASNVTQQPPPSPGLGLRSFHRRYRSVRDLDPNYDAQPLLLVYQAVGVVLYDLHELAAHSLSYDYETGATLPYLVDRATTAADVARLLDTLQRDFAAFPLARRRELQGMHDAVCRSLKMLNARLRTYERGVTPARAAP